MNKSIKQKDKKTKKEATLSPRMYEALELAFKLHGHDTRKSSQVPYMAYLLSMCALVIQDSGDEDEAFFKPGLR